MELALLALAVLPAPQQQCEPGWWEGMSVAVAFEDSFVVWIALGVADLGAGEEIWTSGLNSGVGVGAGPFTGLLRREGNGTWSSPGGAPVKGSARQFAAADFGTGPRMYVAGSIVPPGWSQSPRLVEWDGVALQAFGLPNDDVNSVVAHTEASGQVLYAGGTFTQIGGIAANRVARYDGSTWSPLGAGVPTFVISLCVHDDGSGPSLFAGSTNQQVFRFDGTSWHALPKISAGTGSVTHLLVHDTYLVAYGTTVPLSRWDGTSWSTFPIGPSGVSGPMFPRSVASVDDGSGPRLWTSRGLNTPSEPELRSWKDGDWTVHAVDDAVDLLRASGEPGAQSLYAAGRFTTIESTKSPALAVRHPCGQSSDIAAAAPCFSARVTLGAQSSAPAPGESFDFGILTAGPATSAWVFASGGWLAGVGAGGCGLQLLGIEVLLDPSAFLVQVATLDLVSCGFTGWSGFVGAGSLAIPPIAQLSGIEIALQAVALHGSVARTSNALKFEIQP